MKNKRKVIILTEKEEADICLYCDLPASACNIISCQRFKEQKNKMKEFKRQWGEKKPRKSTSTP